MLLLVAGSGRSGNLRSWPMGGLGDGPLPPTAAPALPGEGDGPKTAAVGWEGARWPTKLSDAPTVTAWNSFWVQTVWVNNQRQMFRTSRWYFVPYILCQKIICKKLRKFPKFPEFRHIFKYLLKSNCDVKCTNPCCSKMEIFQFLVSFWYTIRICVSVYCRHTWSESCESVAPMTLTVPAVPSSSGVFLVDLILRHRKASLTARKATDKLATHIIQSSIFLVQSMANICHNDILENLDVDVDLVL